MLPKFSDFFFNLQVNAQSAWTTSDLSQLRRIRSQGLIFCWLDWHSLNQQSVSCKICKLSFFTGWQYLTNVFHGFSLRIFSPCDFATPSIVSAKLEASGLALGDIGSPSRQLSHSRRTRRDVFEDFLVLLIPKIFLLSIKSQFSLPHSIRPLLALSAGLLLYS